VIGRDDDDRKGAPHRVIIDKRVLVPLPVVSLPPRYNRDNTCHVDARDDNERTILRAAPSRQ